MRLRQKHKTLHTGDGKRRDGSDDGSESDTESKDDDDDGAVSEGDEHASGAEGETMYTDDKPTNGADKDGSGEESDADTSDSDGSNSSDESEASAGQKAHPSLDPPRLVTVKVRVKAINALALLSCQPVPPGRCFFRLGWSGPQPTKPSAISELSEHECQGRYLGCASFAGCAGRTGPAGACGGCWSYAGAGNTCTYSDG